MLRKMLTLGALVVVAVTFGVANGSAAPNAGAQAAGHHGKWTEGFSDGRD